LDAAEWKESAYGKEVMLLLMEALYACGHKVYASIDLKASPTWPFGTMLADEECHFWCCCRPVYNGDEEEVVPDPWKSDIPGTVQIRYGDPYNTEHPGHNDTIAKF
jgi:hypothetical protein